MCVFVCLCVCVSVRVVCVCVSIHTLICWSLDPYKMTSGPRASDWTVPL